MNKLTTPNRMQEKLDQLAGEVANVSATVKTILGAIQGDAALGQTGIVARVAAVELRQTALQTALDLEEKSRAYRRGVEKTITIIISAGVSAVIAFIAAWIGAGGPHPGH